NRHVDDLAVPQSGAADRQLRRVAVDLHHLGALPHRQITQQMGGAFGTDEVGDPRLDSREARHPGELQPRTHPLADLVLRHEEMAAKFRYYMLPRESTNFSTTTRRAMTTNPV